MTLLSFSWFFGLLDVLHGVLNLNFKLCAFCCQWTHQGEIEKPSGQYIGLICDESMTCQGLNLNPGHFGGSTTIHLFMWRITFACLVVCRWQVRYDGQ
jgi:hypothetical protein